MSWEHKIAHKLISSGKTLAIAESCTGGLLSSRLTNVPGSSNFLQFSVVAYSNDAKIKILKIPSSTINKFGAVSSETAVVMAQKARAILNADFGIAITGIAGPSGGTKSKPVGLTYIAVCTSLESLCLKYQLSGNRTSIKRQAATQALRLLWEFLI